MIIIKKVINKKEEIKNKLKNKSKKTITVFLILRLLVIVCMIDQGFNGNWNNVLLCLLTLILFTIPNFISVKYNIALPGTLEAIVYLFIFSSEILGEIQNFYGIFTHWDTILHTLNGFLCAAIGFSLVDILNNNENLHISMSPSFAALVAFSFSMTVGVLWEFCEFGVDKYLYKDMQKDRIIESFQSVKLKPNNDNPPLKVENIKRTEIYANNGEEIIIVDGGYLDIGLIDTMKDLYVNFLGALIFSIIGYLYIKNRDEYKFIERFLPKLKRLE